MSRLLCIKPLVHERCAYAATLMSITQPASENGDDVNTVVVVVALVTNACTFSRVYKGRRSKRDKVSLLSKSLVKVGGSSGEAMAQRGRNKHQHKVLHSQPPCTTLSAPGRSGQEMQCLHFFKS